MKIPAVLVLLPTILLVAAGANADWTVDRDASVIAFTSTKNGAITETHWFSDIKGSVSANGAANLAINLLSVDTRIPIRDERMRNILFDDFATAGFAATVNVASYEAIEPGQHQSIPLAGELEINGRKVKLTLPVIVTRNTDGSVSVVGGGGLDVVRLGFGDGIEELRELAGLNEISPTVTFTFQLRLTQQ